MGNFIIPDFIDFFRKCDTIMNWQALLKENINHVDQLCEALGLSTEEQQRIKTESDMFPMSVSKYYFSLIDNKIIKDIAE